MKKIMTFLVVSVFLLFGLLYFSNINYAQAATHDVAFTTAVQASLSFDITSGDTVAFGNLTPGSPIKGPAASTIATVQTNASNGYTLAVSDAIAGTNSALVHTDTTTYIPDMTNGNITTPVLWGANTGLGITMFAADTAPEGKWCNAVCTSYDDNDNNYAAIPQNATVAHTVTGAVVGDNTSSWAYQIDTTAGQKTGNYAGNMTFTATAVLL